MARALTEVVFQAGLADGRLRRLTTATPSARVTLTPVIINGAGYPTRYLISACGFETRRTAVVEALSTFLADPKVVQEDDQVVSVVGDLAPHVRQELDATLGEALMGFGRDLLFRPALIRGGALYVSVVTTHETSAEETVHRLTKMLAERGLDGRLVRLEPYHPEQQGFGTYEEALTPKQAEILKMALALGLYDTPRRCTLDDLAAVFGISKAAAHNRMKGAERKILARYFEG